MKTGTPRETARNRSGVGVHRRVRPSRAPRFLVTCEDSHGIKRPLPSLNIERKYWVHNGCPTIHVERLPGNKARFVHAQQQDSVANICGSAHSSQRCPTALMPAFNR